MTATTALPFEEICTGDNPEACIIWLHGLGANGHDFVPVVPEIKLNKAVRYIFPHAPSRPVTVNGGMVMPAWYDILSMSIDREIDVPQILESSQAIHNIINDQIKAGIPANKIVVAGFSQGGAVAYQAAFSFPEQLGGLMALSTYLATEGELKIEGYKNLPVLIQHGTRDPIVPELLGQRAFSSLKEKGLQPKYLTYPMEHSVCGDQIADINAWLNEILA
ncbi:MAG TPA: carboxylesterase [Gammaproteobacteria bacterium]|nr:dienelactone hydrolase family protein [Pseudomonadota bacterium]HBF09280.1 carboxylesterase [Gammaproteobacteria bacterium]HCK94350.1 carboxylesterase [Gammaproteobacteria bacterium]|tara:strand:+ start:1126 stop:1785 length:660 start_codon:yes stop_codon:yes gene_type:complete